MAGLEPATEESLKISGRLTSHCATDTPNMKTERIGGNDGDPYAKWVKSGESNSTVRPTKATAPATGPPENSRTTTMHADDDDDDDDVNNNHGNEDDADDDGDDISHQFVNTIMMRTMIMVMLTLVTN
ncbi:hypothetical protein PoB_004315100 [Plakobranchus ocellatus]|uniref:Uncharacterized protein n=1 Tax=Plakobranchus ocellatus TaxID=259542 RepID=A0AAV4AZQ6_9GAST|nr:hypothetical protein PoB_004315100 [Plakobranchus ocellatus]